MLGSLRDPAPGSITFSGGFLMSGGGEEIGEISQFGYPLNKIVYLRKAKESS